MAWENRITVLFIDDLNHYNYTLMFPLIIYFKSISISDITIVYETTNVRYVRPTSTLL